MEIADLFPLFPVQNKFLRHIGITCFTQNGLHTVLNIFDLDRIIPDLRLKIRCDPECHQFQYIRKDCFIFRLKGKFHDADDFMNVKLCSRSVSLDHITHNSLSY